MADQQRTTPRRMPSAEFRSAYARLDEPVDVTVLGRVIGHWYPAGVPGAWMTPLPPGSESWSGLYSSVPVDPPLELKAGVLYGGSDGTPLLPAPRPGPEIPAAENGDGESDQAQIGAPEPGLPLKAPGGLASDSAGEDGARVLAHGTARLGHPSKTPPPAPLNVVDPDFERYFSGAPFDGALVGEGPKREVIHDPGFNSKGSRAVPKTGGKR